MTAKQSQLKDLERRLAEAKEAQCFAFPGPQKGDAKGRKRIVVNGKQMLAHRAMWEAVSGPIPAGKMLCHTCDNAWCVNVKHLYVGTHSDNMRDMKERKRYFAAKDPERCRAAGVKGGKMTTWTSGEGNPRARLNRKDVNDIRLSTETNKTLQQRYGVHRTTIQRARNGRLWDGPSALIAKGEK